MKTAYLTVFEYALDRANELDPIATKARLEEAWECMNGASFGSERADAARQSSTSIGFKAGSGRNIVEKVHKNAEQLGQTHASGVILPYHGPSDSKTRLRGRGTTSSMCADAPHRASPSTIPETQSSLSDSPSEPATLETDRVRGATAGRPGRQQFLRQELGRIRIEFLKPNRNGDTHKVLDRKDMNDIDKIWTGMFAGDGVRALNELIEQYNTELRNRDGPESAARVEAAARDKDTPPEATPLLSVFARLINVESTKRQLLTSLRQHLDMLAFYQYYNELNEEVRKGSPRYDPTLAEGLRTTPGRGTASLVRDFLANQFPRRNRTMVDNWIARSRALYDMTDAFGSKGILCLAEGPMSCKLKRWGLNVMQEVWPLVKQYIPHSEQVCELLQNHILTPIENGRPIKIDHPRKRGGDVYRHLTHLFVQCPETRQGTKRKRQSQESTADNSDQQSMISSAADGF
ncbi:hypothetical protein EDD37DRAFT_339390 [Exophiala viscosa]|uniref:Uncharacterized protein n=1 Tax=Exophiala viscosa TaxID=2486360 RepID=A0AAN6DW66_9EURO|nr:hypothetical protein EDD36DRAFT_488252 [Exophiala viscosa]KAI1626318.1 hypothetical protein EDD37DRAFT_339390 [Exophiala viscosa]